MFFLSVVHFKADHTKFYRLDSSCGLFGFKRSKYLSAKKQLFALICLSMFQHIRLFVHESLRKLHDFEHPQAPTIGHFSLIITIRFYRGFTVSAFFKKWKYDIYSTSIDWSCLSLIILIISCNKLIPKSWIFCPYHVTTKFSFYNMGWFNIIDVCYEAWLIYQVNRC